MFVVSKGKRKPPVLMSVWSTSTGRNSVFGAEAGAGPPLLSHPSIHPHSHAHLPGATSHCFHKRIHTCQVSIFAIFSVQQITNNFGVQYKILLKNAEHGI